MVLHLNVFEPRYVELVHQLRGDRDGFGVVMIERGSEVGGGDQRAPVGVWADKVRLDGGEVPPYELAAVGGRRFRVVSPLDDDPFPRASVEWWPDDAAVGDPVAELDGLLAKYRQMMRLTAQHNATMQDPSVDPADVTGSLWRLALGAPLGAWDRYQVLSAPDAGTRALRLGEAFDDLLAVLTLA